MLRISKCRFLLLVAVIILISIQSSDAAAGSFQRLVSPELLEHAGLKILWESTLPTKTGESLERMLILGDHLYAISDKNYMLSLRRDDGERIFSKIVSLSGLRVDEMSLFNDKLISVAGTRLYEIDPNTGIEHGAVDVGFGIACPAALNGSFFYISGTDRRMHALSIEDKVEVFNVADENDSMITTILADETSVVFGTDQGDIVCIAPNLPVRYWDFKAAGAIAGAIVRDGMSLYFAGEDMNVYRLDIVGTPERRRLIWKYQVDGMLKTSPRVTRGVIYQSVYGRGLTAIDKTNGTALWSAPGAIDLLAEAAGKAYVITKDGILVVMDNSNGKKLYSINCAGVSRHAANVVDSKIYIADKTGRIVCLQPVE